MKTKLGISVGLLGAGMYFMGLFSGYMVLTLLAGYVLLCEQNEWLRRTAVKACATCICFSILFAIIGFIPDVIALIDGVFNIFEGSFHMNIVIKIISLVQTVLSLLQKILLLMLGFKALHQGTVKVKAIDKIIDTYMNKA